MTRWREHLLVVAAILVLASVGALSAMRTAVLDWRFAMAQRAPTGQVVLVGIDTASLSAIGVWPWPRSIYAQLLAKLHEAGASEIAFDVDFSSRTTAAEDQVFAEGLAKAGGGTILPVFKQMTRTSDGGSRFVSTRPLSEFADHAWLGAVNVQPDADGRVRRYPVGLEIGGEYHPSIGSLLGGMPNRSERTHYLDYSIDLRKIPTVSAIDLLEGRVGTTLAGKKVIIGATAIELGDHFPAPKYGIVAGVELQALASDASLQGRMLQQAGWPVTAAGLLAIAALAGVAMRRLSAPIASAVLAGALLTLEVGAQVLQTSTPWSLDTSTWAIAIAAYVVCFWVRELDLRGMLASIAQKRFQSIALTLADAVICVDAQGRITFWNPSAVSIFKCSEAMALGSDFSRFIQGGRSALEGALNTHARGADGVELTGVRADGEQFPLELRLSQWETEEGRNVSVIVRDITARRQSEARIKHLALHDGLTNLANRSSLCDEIRERIARAGPDTRIGVCLIDLDNFKEVNDKLGHDGGDQILRQFATELRARLRNDDCFARLGGDEFAVVCDLNEIALERVTQSIGAVFGCGDRYTFVDGHAFLLSASIGSACYPHDGSTVDELLTNADLALYRAKKRSRAQHVTYDPAFKEEIDSRRALDAELRSAHEQGQFVAYFQPQTRLRDATLVGVEALIRWNHPVRGVVQPGSFLPVLMTSPIAADVGESIMRQACAYGAQWASTGREIRIGVNLFPTQFNPDLPGRIASILAETGLPPRLLEIEITENILLTDDERTIALLREVRNLGVCVALDDFGTGFASLTHLKRFPLDRLKIDRSFVTDFGSDAANTAIVTSIVGLARELGLHTISEGIEDSDCASLLAAVGCDEGQGFYFGRPMTGEDLSSLLSTSPMARSAA